MKIRTFTILDFTIELWDFGYRRYLYPNFNGDAEFPCNKKGYRRLCSYLKTIQWINNQPKLYYYD